MPEPELSVDVEDEIARLEERLAVLKQQLANADGSVRGGQYQTIPREPTFEEYAARFDRKPADMQFHPELMQRWGRPPPGSFKR